MPRGVYLRTEKHRQALRVPRPSTGHYPHPTGERASNWQGGKTKFVRRLRGIKEYKQWRIAVITRDKNRCVVCNKHGNRADHYPMPFSLLLKILKINSVEEAKNNALLWKVHNGRTLCKQCDIKYGSCGFYSRVINDRFIIMKKDKLMEILGAMQGVSGRNAPKYR